MLGLVRIAFLFHLFQDRKISGTSWGLVHHVVHAGPWPRHAPPPSPSTCICWSNVKLLEAAKAELDSLGAAGPIFFWWIVELWTEIGMETTWERWVPSNRWIKNKDNYVSFPCPNASNTSLWGHCPEIPWIPHIRIYIYSIYNIILYNYIDFMVIL